MESLAEALWEGASAAQRGEDAAGVCDPAARGTRSGPRSTATWSGLSAGATDWRCRRTPSTRTRSWTWSAGPAGQLDDGAPQEAERHLVDAFALWRGEPYAEFADGGWFAAEAQRLAEIRLAGLEVRLAAGLALGRDADVVAEAQALCAAHPLHEQFWVHLVTALYRCGRQADALAALRRVRALLAEEIGADPGVELRALEQRVLRQDPTLAAPTHPATAAPLPAELDPAGRPFFGRAEELAWLDEAWADVARGGPGRLLVIAGPAGSGRTRLVAEFAARLHARGVPVHYARVATGLAVLDDLDDQSVGQLAAGLPDGPVLCVATYDPTTASAGLRRALLATAHEERVLAPLGRADIAQIVARVAGPVDAAAGGGDRPRRARPAGRGRTSRRPADRGAVRAAGASPRSSRRGPASQALAAAREEVASGVRDLARVRRGAPERRPARDGSPARTRGWPATSRAMPRCSTAGRSWWRGCARGWSTPRSWPWSARPVRASRRWYGPVCCRRWRPGCCPGSPTPGSTCWPPARRCRCSTARPSSWWTSSRRSSPTSTDDGARQRYLDDLTALAARPDTRIVVVLRGDFVGACAAHAAPGAAARRRHRSGRADAPGGDPPRGRAACAPGRTARRAGPGRRGRVRHAGRAGRAAADVHGAGRGVAGPLRRHADRGGIPPRRRGARRAGPAGRGRLASLDEPAQEAARRILLRLAETGEGGVLVRRRVPRRELGDDPATARALHVLVNRRLLTAGDTGVEVTHEALLSHWPRLAGWLAEDEQGRALRRHLAPAAAEWDAAGRPDTELYRGARLASRAGLGRRPARRVDRRRAGLPGRQPRLRGPRARRGDRPSRPAGPGAAPAASPRSPPRSACSWSPPAPPGRR